MSDREEPKIKRNNFGLHCDDGPAYEDSDVSNFWINDKIHRENGPAWNNKLSKEHLFYICGKFIV